MDTEDYINILDSLASGKDPITGKELPGEGVLNRREVIRALQFAIDSIQENITYVSADSEVEINLPDDKKYILEKENLVQVLKIFKDFNINPSSNSVANFLFGYNSKLFTGEFTQNDRYGILKGLVNKRKLQKFLIKFFDGNKDLIKDFAKARSNYEWKEFDLSGIPVFNKLKSEYVERLRQRVKDLPITKNEEYFKNNPTVLEQRRTAPRAYEPISPEEEELFNKAMVYTNDAKLLSDVFQRNEGTIISRIKKYYYNKEKVSETQEYDT